MIGAEKASIQGTAKPPPVLDEAKLLAITARCGAVGPSFQNGISDMMRITSRSSSKDYEVVACVKHSVGVDFDAFVASGQPNRPVDRDAAAFAKLSSKS